MHERREDLPIDDVLDSIVEALQVRSAVVLKAPTGAGKTTRVPPALLDAGLADGKLVVVLEPRRVAARAAARRIADERDERLGGWVGYQIRFDRKASSATRLLFVTEGVLLRMLQTDPFLETVGALVFDEFHERRLDSDLALAMARRVQREARDDLKLVVMSATLDPRDVATRLGDCPVVESEGRSYPVSVNYLDQPDERRIWTLAAQGVRSIWPTTTGDVLVFLPGVGEIRRTNDLLEAFASESGALLTTLYGNMPIEKQDAVLRRQKLEKPRRRIVLSTNVAETSVTIAGVGCVVDTGFAKVPKYDVGCGLDRLELERISRNSAEQRTGRAGRTGPGDCLRLWTRAQQAGLIAVDTPEVRRVDLAGPVLQLMAWGESDPAAFDWYEAPDDVSLARAANLLRLLGAVGDLGITKLGRQMASLPLAPRLARVLIESYRLGLPDMGSLLVAMLSERNPFRLMNTRWVSDSDVLDRLEALEAHVKYTSGGRDQRGRSNRFEIRNSATLQRIRRVASQLRREAKNLSGTSPRPNDQAREVLKRALLSGYPDRVTRRREGEAVHSRIQTRGVMVGGRGVRLSDSCAVRESDLFVCVDLDAGRRGQRAEAWVREASAVERDWLEPSLLTEQTAVRFDEASERVICEAQTTYIDLVLETRRISRGDPEKVSVELAKAASTRLATALPLARPDVAGLLTRVRCLNEWLPNLELPAVDEERFRELLPVLCQGRRSFSELRSLSSDELLSSVLSWEQRRLVEQLAPERLTVPSGSLIKLRYEEGKPPVLAVRIQEVFGLAETPKIANGRVPVLMHLLAPNMRPQQVTHDLASFWANTYAEVRKELRQRYPRHAWPVDPMKAKPERK